MFGENFERFVPDLDANPAAALDAPAKPADKAKKGKVAAKATGLQYQFQIMESMGVPREEIKKFADPYFWLKYYPPICIVSARSFVFARPGGQGSSLETRRSGARTSKELEEAGDASRTSDYTEAVPPALDTACRGVTDVSNSERTPSRG